MSIPETESAQAAERAATAAAAAPGKADPPDDPRLPWHGKPRAADIVCWLGISRGHIARAKRDHPRRANNPVS